MKQCDGLIYINEHLTRSMKSMTETKKKIAEINKMKYVWVRASRILTGRSDGALVLQIISSEDLTKLMKFNQIEY